METDTWYSDTMKKGYFRQRIGKTFLNYECRVEKWDEGWEVKTCCRSGRENKNTTSSDVPVCCCWVSSDGGSAYHSGGRWE